MVGACKFLQEKREGEGNGQANRSIRGKSLRNKRERFSPNNSTDREEER
jgi:hypothetical protein